jgi:hypothetical protein
VKPSAQLESTLSELSKHGASVLSITDTANSHTKVTFRHEGWEQFVIVGKNASDFRAPDNARKAVRRQLGIHRAKVTGKRRFRRNTANRAAPTAPEHFTLLPDPWRSIQGTAIAQQTAAFAADQAWKRLFGLCLLNVDYVPTHPSIRQAIGLRA